MPERADLCDDRRRVARPAFSPQEGDPMNTREHLVQCFKHEKPKFVRVLQAVPGDQLGYRPHPRSSSAGEIAWLLASELKDACDLIDHGKVDYVQTPPPRTASECVACYERNVGEL